MESNKIKADINRWLSYDKSPGTILRYKKTAEFVNKNGKLLDIGARGAEFKTYVSPEVDYNALDLYDKKEICFLKKRGIKAKRGVIEKIPFKNNSFDIIVLTEIIEHLPNPGIALKEVKRVLKKDGIVIVSVPNGELVRRIYRAIINLPRYVYGTKLKTYKEHECGGHLYMFTKQHIKLLFEMCGFKIEKCRSNMFDRSIIFRARPHW